MARPQDSTAQLAAPTPPKQTAPPHITKETRIKIGARDSPSRFAAFNSGEDPGLYIRYFENVERKLGKAETAEFARLYTAPGRPGAGECRHGPCA
jgi:hypothetical protein